MRLLLVDENCWNCVNLKVLLRNLRRCRIEGSMGLIHLSYVVERVPEETRLRSDVGEEHRIVALQQIHAVHSGHLLYWWSRHSHNELQQLLLGSFSVEHVLVVALDAEMSDQ